MQRFMIDIAPAFAKLGLKLEMVTLQNISLPDELQKILDQKIGMGMVGFGMAIFATNVLTQTRAVLLGAERKGRAACRQEREG